MAPSKPLYPVHLSPQTSSAVSLPLSRRSLSSSSSITAAVNTATDNNTAQSIHPRIPSSSSTAVSHFYELEDRNKMGISPMKANEDASSINAVAMPASDNMSEHEIQFARYPSARLTQRRELILETSSAPRRPYSPLSEQQKKLARMHRNSVDKRSIVPILYFLAASLGKL